MKIITYILFLAGLQCSQAQAINSSSETLVKQVSDQVFECQIKNDLYFILKRVDNNLDIFEWRGYQEDALNDLKRTLQVIRLTTV